MKTKTLRFVILLLCFLMILPSCDTNMPDESETESEAISTEMKTEKETEKQTEKQTEKETETAPEWETMVYPDAEDNEPNLEAADYSKISFCPEFITYSSDQQLAVSNLADARKIKDYVEANESRWKQVTCYDEGLVLLKGIIADSKNEDCALMVILEYASDEMPWVFSVNTHYKARYELEYNGGEKQIVLFYSKKWIENGFTPSLEKLMETFERYTMYSSFTRVVISAVPIPADE